MPSPLLYIAAEPSGLTRTVHEYRTQLTDRLADEFTPLVPRSRRSELYQAAVRIVDEALPAEARGLTVPAIAAAREKLRSVAVYLQSAPGQPSAARKEEGLGALAAARAALAAQRRKLAAGPAKPELSLARMRQELHTAAREVTLRHEQEQQASASTGSASASGGARVDLMAAALQSSKMQAALAGKRASEAVSKAEAEASWARRALKQQSHQQHRESEDPSVSGPTLRMQQPLPFLCCCLSPLRSLTSHA